MNNARQNARKPRGHQQNNNAKSSPSSSLSIKDRLNEIKARREKELQHAVANGLMAEPGTQRPLSEAITLVGTCQDMCPEYERIKRIDQRDVWEMEYVPVTPRNKNRPRVADEARMIKKFRRPAAGLEEQLPSDLRPPKILQKTLDYLVDEVVGKAKDLTPVYNFVWDRTRGIRNDFSVQQLTDVPQLRTAIECFERIVRLHILTRHVIGGKLPKKGEGYDHHQDLEQGIKSLVSLMAYYDLVRDSYKAPNEPEFRAYWIISQLPTSMESNLESRIQSWPRDVLNHPKVKLARKMFATACNVLNSRTSTQAIAQQDFMQFWRLIKSPETSYLTACCAEIFFDMIRKPALFTILQAYSRGRGRSVEDWILDHMTKPLGLDNEEQVEEYVEAHGCTVKEQKGTGHLYLDVSDAAHITYRHIEGHKVPREQYFSQSMVEPKRRGRSYPAIINGLSLKEALAQGLVDKNALLQPAPSGIEDDEESLFVPTDREDEVTSDEQEAEQEATNGPTTNGFNIGKSLFDRTSTPTPASSSFTAGTSFSFANPTPSASSVPSALNPSASPFNFSSPSQSANAPSPKPFGFTAGSQTPAASPKPFSFTAGSSPAQPSPFTAPSTSAPASPFTFTANNQSSSSSPFTTSNPQQPLPGTSTPFSFTPTNSTSTSAAKPFSFTPLATPAADPPSSAPVNAAEASKPVEPRPQLLSTETATPNPSPFNSAPFSAPSNPFSGFKPTATPTAFSGFSSTPTTATTQITSATQPSAAVIPSTSQQSLPPDPFSNANVSSSSQEQTPTQSEIKPGPSNSIPIPQVAPSNPASTFSSTVSKPSVSNQAIRKEACLDYLAKQLFLGKDNGFLKQYIEFVATPIYDQEKDEFDADTFRAHNLATKYFTIWRRITVIRKKKRRGVERRARILAESANKSRNKPHEAPRQPADYASAMADYDSVVEKAEKAFRSSGASHQETEIPNGFFDSPFRASLNSSIFDDPTSEHRLGIDKASSPSTLHDKLKPKISSRTNSPARNGTSTPQDRDTPLRRRRAAPDNTEQLLRAHFLTGDPLRNGLEKGRLSTMRSDYFKMKALGLEELTTDHVKREKRKRLSLEHETGESTPDPTFYEDEGDRTPYLLSQDAYNVEKYSLPTKKRILHGRASSMGDRKAERKREREDQEDEELFMRARRAMRKLDEKVDWWKGERGGISSGNKPPGDEY